MSSCWLLLSCSQRWEICKMSLRFCAQNTKCAPSAVDPILQIRKKANPSSHLTLHDPQTYICRPGLLLTIQSIKLFHVNQVRTYFSRFLSWIPKRKDILDFPLGTGFNRLVHDAKQLFDEAKHDIMDYQNRGLCYGFGR